jgi:hypothetical protein
VQGNVRNLLYVKNMVKNFSKHCSFPAEFRSRYPRMRVRLVAVGDPSLVLVVTIFKHGLLRDHTFLYYA